MIGGDDVYYVIWFSLLFFICFLQWNLIFQPDTTLLHQLIKTQGSQLGLSK